MKLVEKSILGLKTIFQNFVSYTSGIKSFCRDFQTANRFLLDKSSSFSAIGNDICECHSQIEKSYEELVSAMNELNSATTQWNNLFSQAKHAIQKREESRKVYDHYDEKMEKLYRSRQEKMRRNISENPKDYELVMRNEQKYKKATEEYIGLSVTAFEFMNDALNSRYESITPILSRFIELENKFYQQVFNSFRTLENIDYKFKMASKKFVKADNTYDPAKYIRGGDVIRNETEMEKSKQEVKPRSKSSLPDRTQVKNPVREKDFSDFDQIENKFSGLDKKQSSSRKPARQVVEQEPEQTEIPENYNNPYSNINLNSSNISYVKNKYQQQQNVNKRSSTPNQFLVNNNQNNMNNIPNFDFDFGIRSSNSNQQQNQFDFLRNSNTIKTSNNMNYGNVSNTNVPSFNFNQNQGSNVYNQQPVNFGQNNNNNVNNFDFGMLDFTNQNVQNNNNNMNNFNQINNNFQQNMQNVNNGMNFYQNNQNNIQSFGNSAMSMNNNLNNMGITTGIPTTNYNLPANNKQTNNDIFQDFFK